MIANIFSTPLALGRTGARARGFSLVEMALVLQNDRGQELHRRTGLLKSEPMVHGSGGSNNFTNRFIWNDTSVVA